MTQNNKETIMLVKTRIGKKKKVRKEGKKNYQVVWELN